VVSKLQYIETGASCVTITSMDLQYPVGKFAWPGSISGSERNALIEEIAATPAKMRAAVAGLSDAQLDTPYRPGGWTARQVVHHIADSHMNAYIRTKLALTESEPTIKAYDQDTWAMLPDATLPVEVSLNILDGVHQRWVVVLRSLSEKDLARTFVHPEIGPMALDKNVALYAWHGRHHIGHVLSVRS
jgi:uncharacterized damage-inducible protein DinB